MPSISTTFRRDLAPPTMRISRLAVWSAFASSSTSASLAALSTGGAVNRTRSAPSRSPAISLREARGWTWTLKRTPVSRLVMTRGIRLKVIEVVKDVEVIEGTSPVSTSTSSTSSITSASRRTRLGRRVGPARSAARDPRALLDPLDQREQPVPLQWKCELGHHQPLHCKGQRAIRLGLGARPIEQSGAPDRERETQRCGIGTGERALDDGDERHLAARADVRVGHAVKHPRLMARGGERLRDALEQRVLGPNQKNDRHAFTSLDGAQRAFRMMPFATAS